MRSLVWDFGSLEPDVEERYIRQIVGRYVSYFLRGIGKWDSEVIMVLTFLNIESGQRYWYHHVIAAKLTDDQSRHWARIIPQIKLMVNYS